MQTDDIKGLVILTGFLTVGAFLLGGLMERKLKNLDRIILKIEDDNKYIN